MLNLNIDKLKANFSGYIILPNDPEYSEARLTYAIKNAEPSIIAQAVSNEDVAAAIKYSIDHKLQISVRSGKHSVAGFSTNNGGLVLDLSKMDRIEVLDKKRGLVRLGTGATWGDVASKLAEHNLAISSGDTKTVGVGGLTLGGGIGWMVRKYGYAIDNLVSAEVVLADGSVVIANESKNSDLFWALKGGGGNFGVVTSFEFKAHPQGKIVESTQMYGVMDVKNVITGWRNHMRSAILDLTSFLTLFPGFPGMPPGVMIMSCYDSDEEDVAALAIEPLRSLGKLLNDHTAVKDYTEMLQEAHPPEGMKFIVKNMYIKILDDELIDLLSEISGKPGTPIVQIRIMSGAIDDVDSAATAIPHRGNEAFLFAGFPLPMDAGEEEEAKMMLNWDKLSQYSNGAYSNFLSTNTAEDIASIYPKATYKKLAVIKQKYDPKNIFNHNFNIKPSK